MFNIICVCVCMCVCVCVERQYILGWPKCLIGFFHMMLWENFNKLFAYPPSHWYTRTHTSQLWCMLLSKSKSFIKAFQVLHFFIFVVVGSGAAVYFSYFHFGDHILIFPRLQKDPRYWKTLHFPRLYLFLTHSYFTKVFRKLGYILLLMAYWMISSV